MNVQVEVVEMMHENFESAGALLKETKSKGGIRSRRQEKGNRWIWNLAEWRMKREDDVVSQ